MEFIKKKWKGHLVMFYYFRNLLVIRKTVSNYWGTGICDYCRNDNYINHEG